MKSIIHSQLEEIEKDYSVKILYACEAGSRAWNLQSKDSDYDVRFIYVHPTSYYLSIDPIGIGQKKDVIDLPINQSLDIEGFELTKALRLLRKSNPNILEWLHTDIVYVNKKNLKEGLLEIVPNIFEAKACIYHYLNIAKQNFRVIQKQNEQSIKRYIQIIRSVLITKWIIEYNTFPPMQIEKLINIMTMPGLNGNLIHLLIDRKREQENPNFSVEQLHPFINQELDFIESYLSRLPKETSQSFTKELDEFFRETLRAVWS